MSDAAQMQARTDEFRKAYGLAFREIARVIVGHTDIVHGILTCLFVGGHALLEGVPGLGKTLLVRTLSEVLDFFGVMQMTRAEWIGFANNHSIHHRGQLAAYLRAMGSKVPNIYGPSADAKSDSD